MACRPARPRWRRRSNGARSGRCCSSPTRPRSTASSGSRSRATGSASPRCSASTSSTGCARSSRSRSRWPRPGTRRPIERGQAVAAREARAVGIHWTFAPMVDIARDPRWGRIVEGAGEDPFLGAAVAVAQVRGFQGDGVGTPERVIAGPKHFAGYGAALGGRDYDEVNLSDSELWNVYLPPFAAAVEAGAGNVMTAYMDLNGVPATGNRWLFTEVLRDDLGLRGVRGQRRQRRTQPGDARLRRRPDRRRRPRPERRRRHGDGDRRPRLRAPARGAGSRASSSEADARRRVRRMLEAKLRLGLFDDPYVDEDRAREVLADPAHREVARHRRPSGRRCCCATRATCCRSTPTRSARSRSSARSPTPGATRSGPGCFDFDLDETVTVLDGIRAPARATAYGSSYAPGVPAVQRVFASMFDMFGGNAPADPDGFDDDAELHRAVDLAGDADVAVVVVGEWQNMIGEAASRSSLELPGRQLELLQAVVGDRHAGRAAGHERPPARPALGRRARARRSSTSGTPARQGGAAVANLLFGDVAPGGKLPFTWPRTVGQVPMVYSHTRSPTSRRTRAGATGTSRARRCSRSGTACPTPRFDVRRPRRRPRRDRPRTSTVTVSVDGDQHRRPRRRRGRAALPPPAPRHGLATGPRAQGLRAGHPGGGRVAHGRASRSGRPSCATGTPPRGTGSSTPRPSTSGSAATPPRS